MTTPSVSFAPMQGFTDYFYRNAHHKIIGGVCDYYTPYIKLDRQHELSKKYLRDIHPDNNFAPVVPQLLVQGSLDAILLCTILEGYGYEEVNINLGCPYKMVVNRGMGAGLLPHPERVVELLTETLSKVKLRVSVKLRLGLDNGNDIFTLLPLLDQFPLTKIIIHPRTAIQLYKGRASVDDFVNCMDLSRHSLVYNGDINGIEKAASICEQVGNPKELMIGRGMLENVFLALEVQHRRMLPDEKREHLRCFYACIEDGIREHTAGFSHAHNKLFHFWTYFGNHFEGSAKLVKKIKKAKNIKQYEAVVSSLWRDGCLSPTSD